jgi:hypothetical protein
MLPMAVGAAQTAPLAIAVIGGLCGSLAATLFIVPGAFVLATASARFRSPSIDPDDPSSRFYAGDSHAVEP